MAVEPHHAPEERPAAAALEHVPFAAHVELLQFFLARRRDAVERIQALLNAQRKPADYLRDTKVLSRHFEDCVFTVPGLTEHQWRLRGQLEQAHWADGFKPRDIAGLHNGLIEPAEMIARAFHLWQHTRWPGRNGRIHYAHTLFNLYILRCLELLGMRVWDAGPADATGRLAQVQGVLGQLWSSAPADQPALVRDARWLIQLAQSPATDDLGAYFIVAGKQADSFPRDVRLPLHAAGARMTAGHLRSQIRYFSTRDGVPFDDRHLVRNTRNSNALDFALLIQDLVPLLEAYEAALHAGETQRRLELADAICQGISPDPDLFVNGLELLGAYSMIEPIFTTTDPGGHASYSAIGARHVRLLDEYTARIGRLSPELAADCAHFRPTDGSYSPYGVLYGFSSNLVEHMAFKMLQPDADPRFGLEDVFVAGDSGKLAWVTGWRKLPHLTREVETLFDYPQQFAEDVFERVASALHRRASGGNTTTAAQTGRLLVAAANAPATDHSDPIPDLPAQYIWSSDSQIVAAGKAEHHDERQLVSDRHEGKFLVSFKTPGGWVALTKSILTDVLGEGRHARIRDLPPEAVDVLTLTCPGLVVRP